MKCVIKRKKCILTHIVEFRKTVQMNLFGGQKQKHRCGEWTGEYREGRGKWDELSEQNLYTHTHYHVGNSQGEAAVQQRNFYSGLWDDLEGRGGRETQQGRDIGIIQLIHFTIQQKLTRKAIILQLKKKKGGVKITKLMMSAPLPSAKKKHN